MKRACLILLTFAACLVSCSKKGGTIPADKLAGIYADMLIMDQWVRNNSAQSRSADTSLVYEPIIRRHGYTVDQYIRTVEKYLRTPGDFSDVFEQTRRNLQARADYLTAVEEQKNLEKERRERTDARTDYRRARIFTVDGEPTLAVRIELDSIGYYNLERILPDTLYDGPLLIIRDSLLKDSLSLRDGAPADSLAALADSVSSDPLRTVSDTVQVTDPVPAEGKPGALKKERKDRPAPDARRKELIKINEENSIEIPVPAE